MDGSGLGFLAGRVLLLLLLLLRWPIEVVDSRL
jgi:hypothetical protein